MVCFLTPLHVLQTAKSTSTAAATSSRPSQQLVQENKHDDVQEHATVWDVVQLLALTGTRWAGLTAACMLWEDNKEGEGPNKHLDPSNVKVLKAKWFQNDL